MGDNVLDVANGLVHGDRNKDYGHPLDDFARTANQLNALFKHKLVPGEEFVPHEIALIMIAVKMSRLINDPSKHDSIVDIAGYAETFNMVLNEQARRNTAVKDVEVSLFGVSASGYKHPEYR